MLKHLTPPPPITNYLAPMPLVVKRSYWLRQIFNHQQQQVGNTLKIAAITPLTDGSNQLLFNQATSQATQLSVYDVSARQVVNQTLAQGITTANFTPAKRW